MALDEEQVRISEKIRFWEEQDEINKALIPRVIRQHELLTMRIGEHEDLPLMVAQVAQQAVEASMEEQRKLYDSALESVKAEFDERSKIQQRQYDDSLNAAHVEFTAILDATSRRLRNISLAAAGAVIAALMISVLIAFLIG